MSDAGLFSRLCSFPSSYADKPALVTIDGQVVTFARLTRTIVSFAGHAVKAGIVEGDRIAIEVPNEAVRICLILALLRIGAVAIAGASVDSVLKGGVAVSGVITQRMDYRTSPRHIAFNQTWFEPIEPEPRGASAAWRDPAKPCLIMSSSGSTGLKKFMEFSFDMLWQRLEWDRTIFANDPRNRLVTLGFGTDFGLRQALRTLQEGRLLVRPGASPAATIDLMRTHQINELITTPLILNDLVKSIEARPIPLPRLKSLVTVGGPIAGDFARRAGELFEATVTNVYGSTETGLIAVAKDSKWFAKEGASGSLVPWIDLQIVDETGRPQPRGSIGDVRVRLDRRFSVESYLSSRPSQDEPIREGWFYPGDLGAVSEAHELTIVGRTRELINTGGTKISPAAIEDQLGAIRGIEQIAAVGLRNKAGFDDLGIAIRRSPDIPLATIDQAIRKILSRSRSIRIIEMDRLPATETGKIDRMHLKKIFEEH